MLHRPGASASPGPVRSARIWFNSSPDDVYVHSIFISTGPKDK